jgi:hypothetical protein
MSISKLLGAQAFSTPEAYVEITFPAGLDLTGPLLTDENDAAARAMFGGTSKEWAALGYDLRMEWRQKAHEARR